MDYRPRVLLLHPDPSISNAWADALHGCDTRQLVDLAQLETALVEQASDVVVARWSEDLQNRIRSCRPTVEILHVEAGDPRDLLQAVAQGHRVACAANLDELRRKVFELARPARGSVRQACAGLAATWPGLDRPKTVLDISTDGFSFASDTLDGLQMATLLTDVELRRDGELVVAGVNAQVRHVEVRADEYRIGCQLRRASAVAPSDARQVRDRAICAGLIQSALNAGSLVLETADDDDLICTEGTVDLVQGEFVVSSVRHTLRVFDVVDARFEVSSSAYRFRAAVCGESPLRIRLPDRITEWHQRATLRHSVARGKASALLDMPFSGQPVRRRVRDLSATGMSFELIREHDLVPLGMELRRMVLEFGGREFEMSGRVRNVQRTADGYRCGVQFTAMTEETRRNLCDAIVRERVPGIADASAVDFDELWRFFGDTGFVAPEKEALLTPHLAEVRATTEAIRAPNDVSRGVVIREAGELVAHVAGLRAYDDTWMFHHLAAAKGKRAGTVVSLGAIEHLMQNADYEYFRCWFLANATFPVAAFAGFARKLPDPELSDLRRFAHFSLPVERRFGGTLTVGEATDVELAVVERALVASHRGIVIRSESLTRSGLRLAAVDRDYRSIGLRRDRRVLVAREGTTPLGFALAEVSSIGLNLSDALSSFRLFVLPGAMARAAEVRRSLLDGVLPLYAATGRTIARCLVDPDQAAAYTELGIEVDAAQSLCWTCHRSQLRPWSEHMEHLFARLVQRRRSALKLANAA